MKYCTKCGAEMLDEAVVCVKCGYQLNAENLSTENESMEEPENATTQNENDIIDTPKKIEKLMFWKWSKKKMIIASSILAIVILAGAISILKINDVLFLERVANEVRKEYPDAHISCNVDTLTMDTNPFTNSEEKNLAAEFAMGLSRREGENLEQDTVFGVGMVNEKLGFPPSLYSKMIKTTPAMGLQTDENDKFYVSWSYHPNKGLEVKWEKKK